MLRNRLAEPRRSETLTMSSTRSLLAPAARGGLSGLLLLAIPLLLGADDDYLREIEEEARRQATALIASPPPSSSTAPTAPTAKADRLEAGLNPAAFEQALRQQLPEAYTVYQQLDANRKKQVYRAYQNDNQFTSISQRITQLLGGKP